MKYPVFTYSNFTYIFVPPVDLKRLDTVYKNIEEIKRIGIKTFPLYVFIGETTLIFTSEESEGKNIKLHSINKNIPPTYDLYNFDNIEDETDYGIYLDKKTSDKLRDQLTEILDNYEKQNEI